MTTPYEDHNLKLSREMSEDVAAEDRGLRLPQWASKIILILSTSVIVFGATHFLDNAIENQSQNDRIQALEKTMAEVIRKQDINTDWRNGMTADWKTFKEQYERDRISLIQGQREILQRLEDHDRHGRAKNQKLILPTFPAKMGPNLLLGESQ